MRRPSEERLGEYTYDLDQFIRIRNALDRLAHNAYQPVLDGECIVNFNVAGVKPREGTHDTPALRTLRKTT